MKRQEPNQLKGVFELLMKQRGLWPKYTEAKIKNEWPVIVGKTIAKATTRLEFRDRKLFISLNSSIIRNELLMLRTQLVDVVNAKAGGNIIDDVVIM